MTERHKELPGVPIEAWAEDEHRVGLKSIVRRIWAPKGTRPMAAVKEKYEWLYVYAFVHTTRPDAVLLDIRLREKQRGWDVLEQLQAEPDTRTIPVVVWSGDVRRLDEKQAWLADHHIPVLAKPFDLDEMYACLDQALYEHQVLRDECVMVPAS